MSQEKTTLEMIAPTVEEAVTRGLDQLGLPAEAVQVEVLDPGSRGIFGLGSRQARVRLVIQAPPEPVVEQLAPVAAPVKPAVVEKPAEPVATPQPVSEGEDRALTVAREVVLDLLDKMKMKSKVTSVSARYITVPETEEPVVMVDVQGADLSILIGRRSETLNALQYISGLIVGKELEKWVPLMLDIQGYRSRRERQLRQLAQRMAEQAIHTGRRQVLEPMPPNERRLIHLELRDNPKVSTESIGEEPNRKVTICPKK